MSHRVAQSLVKEWQDAVVERHANEGNRMKVIASEIRENELEDVDIEPVGSDHGGRKETLP